MDPVIQAMKIPEDPGPDMGIPEGPWAGFKDYGSSPTPTVWGIHGSYDLG